MNGYQLLSKTDNQLFENFFVKKSETLEKKSSTSFFQYFKKLCQNLNDVPKAIKSSFAVSFRRSCCKLSFCCKLFKNQPTGPCLHLFTMIQTCTYSTSVHVTTLHSGEEFESISKFLIGNRFHAALRIFSPPTLFN